MHNLMSMWIFVVSKKYVLKIKMQEETDLFGEIETNFGYQCSIIRLESLKIMLMIAVKLLLGLGFKRQAIALVYQLIILLWSFSIIKFYISSLINFDISKDKTNSYFQISFCSSICR